MNRGCFLLGTAVENGNRTGRAGIFIEKLLKSESFGFGSAHVRSRLIGEVEHHEVRTS